MYKIMLQIKLLKLWFVAKKTLPFLHSLLIFMEAWQNIVVVNFPFCEMFLVRYASVIFILILSYARYIHVVHV